MTMTSSNQLRQCKFQPGPRLLLLKSGRRKHSSSNSRSRQRQQPQHPQMLSRLCPPRPRLSKLRQRRQHMQQHPHLLQPKRLQRNSASQLRSLNLRQRWQWQHKQQHPHLLQLRRMQRKIMNRSWIPIPIPRTQKPQLQLLIPKQHSRRKRHNVK